MAENTIKNFEKVGYLPVRKSVLNSIEIKSLIKKNPNFKVPIEELNYSRALPYHREFFKINQILIVMFERIMLKESDPVFELEKTEREINKMLE